MIAANLTAVRGLYIDTSFCRHLIKRLLSFFVTLLSGLAIPHSGFSIRRCRRVAGPIGFTGWSEQQLARSARRAKFLMTKREIFQSFRGKETLCVRIRSHARRLRTFPTPLGTPPL